MKVEKLAMSTVNLLAEKVTICNTQVCRHCRILTTRICLSYFFCSVDDQDYDDDDDYWW